MTRCERSVPGLRTISSATVAAEVAGAAFDGLPAGIGRSDLMRAIEKGGPRCGLSRTEVRRLVYGTRGPPGSKSLIISTRRASVLPGARAPAVAGGRGRWCGGSRDEADWLVGCLRRGRLRRRRSSSRAGG